MTLVVDASVAVKWFIADEPEAVQAQAIVRSGVAIAAPDLVIAEVWNAAWRSARLGRIERAQVLAIAASAPAYFETLVSATALASAAVVIAVELDHPVYDCLYVALAEMRQERFVTADQRLLDKIQGTRWATSILALADYSRRA